MNIGIYVIRLKCDACAHKQVFKSYDSVQTAQAAKKAGWILSKGSLLCPKCVKNHRNG